MVASRLFRRAFSKSDHYEILILYKQGLLNLLVKSHLEPTVGLKVILVSVKLCIRKKKKKLKTTFPCRTLTWITLIKARSPLSEILKLALTQIYWISQLKVSLIFLVLDLAIGPISISNRFFQGVYWFSSFLVKSNTSFSRPIKFFKVSETYWNIKGRCIIKNGVLGRGLDLRGLRQLS